MKTLNNNIAGVLKWGLKPYTKPKKPQPAPQRKPRHPRSQQAKPPPSEVARAHVERLARLEQEAQAMSFAALARSLRELLRTRGISRTVALKLLDTLEQKIVRSGPGVATETRILANLRADWASPGPSLAPASLPGTVHQVPWVLIPPGDAGLAVTRVLAAVRDYAKRNPHLSIEEERIRYACSLRPQQMFVGRDQFDGYCVFVFASIQRVLVEHPLKGNAAFVFLTDWRRLSKLSKSDLVRRSDAIRIIHKGEWKAETRRALRIGR